MRGALHLRLWGSAAHRCRACMEVWASSGRLERALLSPPPQGVAKAHQGEGRLEERASAGGGGQSAKGGKRAAKPGPGAEGGSQPLSRRLPTGGTGVKRGPLPRNSPLRRPQVDLLPRPVGSLRGARSPAPGEAAGAAAGTAPSGPRRGEGGRPEPKEVWPARRGREWEVEVCWGREEKKEDGRVCRAVLRCRRPAMMRSHLRRASEHGQSAIARQQSWPLLPRCPTRAFCKSNTRSEWGSFAPICTGVPGVESCSGFGVRNSHHSFHSFLYGKELVLVQLV